MSGAIVSFDDNLSGVGLRIGIVQARFNDQITDAMTDACQAELRVLGVAEDDIDVVTVPGALEIGLALNLLEKSSDYDGLVAIGCVIRGDTYHFEIVCNEACRAVTQIGLETGIPIANAILTVENEAQSHERIVKGRDAARVIVELARLVEQIADR